MARCFSTEMNLSITKRGPGTKNVDAAIADMRKSDVLVGIPQSRNRARRKAAIGNAALLYLHTHGSPLQGIPPRPVIEPAIAADGNRQIIAAELKDAARELFARELNRARVSLRRAGQAGANAATGWFTDPRNHWAPNRPATIRRKGSDRPLIDTGALRASITYVVRSV